MKRTIASVIAMFLLQFAFAQHELVPKQYRSIKKISGDLDKDSIEEKVVVYNVAEKEDEVEGVDRELVIYKKTNNKWMIWQRSASAIGNSKDGGMMGDPFEDIIIKNGLLLVSQAGGSSWKWGYTDKYRYQDGAMQLIGHTSNYGKLCEYWTNVDYNVMTGRMVITKEFEKCDDNDKQVIYKKQNESFVYKLKTKILMSTRDKDAVKIISPKYKHEIYL